MSKIDSKGFTYVTPLRWSTEVLERADTPVAALLDENKALSLSWVHKQSIYMTSTSIIQLKNHQQASTGHILKDLVGIEYWDHQGTDEITLIQVVIAARNMLHSIYHAVSPDDIVHHHYLGDITVGEIAYLIARNRLSVLDTGFLSVLGWRTVTKRFRPITEPYSALAWRIDYYRFPSDHHISIPVIPNPLSWKSQYGMKFDEFVEEAYKARLGFDTMLRYRDGKVPCNLILQFHNQGIDPELATSLVDITEPINQ